MVPCSLHGHQSYLWQVVPSWVVLDCLWVALLVVYCHLGLEYSLHRALMGACPSENLCLPWSVVFPHRS
jgi:hypothetical protein